MKDATQPFPNPLTAGNYRYENGQLILSYSTSQGSNIGNVRGEPRKHWNEIAVWSVVKAAGTFDGTNAYGVSAPIMAFERDTVAFRFNVGPDHPIGIFRRAVVTLTPSEARSLASVAVLEIKIEGPVDAFGQPDCKTAVLPARISRPIEVRDTVCEAFVGVSSIRLVRRDTGEEIPTNPLE